MEGFEVVKFIAILSSLLVVSVNGQVSSPCTATMITSLTPCMNFITGSSNNGSSPPISCCDSLKSLTSTSMDCACLLVTANVPVQLPINRTLAISLPRACKMAGVPVQCKASGTPLPAPGPVLLGPTLPPPAVSPLSTQASNAVAPTPAPASETALPLPPASPPVQVEAPPASPPVQVEAPSAKAGIRPVLMPSASMPSYISPSSSLLIFLAVMVFKCC